MHGFVNLYTDLQPNITIIAFSNNGLPDIYLFRVYRCIDAFIIYSMLQIAKQFLLFQWDADFDRYIRIT